MINFKFYIASFLNKKNILRETKKNNRYKNVNKKTGGL